MRGFTCSLALLATLAAGLPAPAGAESVSPDLAARLRDAVTQSQPQLGTAASAQPASFSTDALDHLVAPVALYPDALLAQVLVAATLPDQVSAAGQLIDRAGSLSDAELADAVAAQHWDESVLVLLAGFPSVLSRMAGDIGWTRDLGAAVTGDNAAVMAAVQTMRARAIAEGNLASNRAQVVATGSDGISIRPADPKVVYVPEYDPDTIYTTREAVYSGPAPVAVSEPGVNPFVAGAIGFGAGLLVANLFNDHHHDDDGGTPYPPPEPWGPNYWQRHDVFDWHAGTFHPRPQPGAPAWTPQRARVAAPAPAAASRAPAPRHAAPAPAASTLAAAQHADRRSAPTESRPSRAMAAHAPRPEHRPPAPRVEHAQAAQPAPQSRQAKPQPEAGKPSPAYCQHHPNDRDCRRS